MVLGPVLLARRRQALLGGLRRADFLLVVARGTQSLLYNPGVRSHIAHPGKSKFVVLHVRPDPILLLQTSQHRQGLDPKGAVSGSEPHRAAPKSAPVRYATPCLCQ